MTQNNTTKGLAALALTAIVTGFSHAGFQTQGTKAVFTAGATLTGAGTISMTTSVKDRLSNATETALTWSSHVSPAPGAGFLLADQYIQLNTNITTSNPGGVQIYTDNTAATASPKFTGDKTVLTPAGLISGNDTTKKLPTAWAISATTATTPTNGSAVVAPIAADPNSGTPGSFAWLFHEDAAQVAITAINATAFANGADYVTAYKNNAGLHFAQAPTSFGGFKPVDVNYIYTEADFTAATTPNTYGTNQLVVEAYTL